MCFMLVLKDFLVLVRGGYSRGTLTNSKLTESSMHTPHIAKNSSELGPIIKSVGTIVFKN